MQFRYIFVFRLIFLCILTTYLAYISYSALSVLNVKIVSDRFLPGNFLNITNFTAQISNKKSNLRRIAAQYTISPTTCPKDQEFLVILIVFSRPSGFGLRQTIRKTWGSLVNPFCGVRLLFMLGTVRSTNLQAKVRREADEFGDIIQSNQFEDGYRSAAQKAPHLLQWGATFCRHSAFIAKVDDDNWVNLPRFVKYLQGVRRRDQVHGSIYGAGSPVWREWGTLYSVTREEYPEDVYVEYLSGMLYTFPTRVIGRVLEASKHLPRTFNDDVFVTGLATNAANLTRIHMTGYVHGLTEDMGNCPKCQAMCIHHIKPIDFYRFWNDPCCRYDELC